MNSKCQIKKPISACNSKKTNSKNSTLATLVDEYSQQYGNFYYCEDRWWGEKTISWLQAVKRAWESIMPNGKMHGHQYRVGEQKLSEGLQICQSHNRQPDSFNDFHDIYCWIESITKDVKRIGSLTTYDVARRLGAWLDLKPQKVYLHAGAMRGARKLGIQGDMVSLDNFPSEIQKLGATHAENFLCIYKDYL